MGLQVHMEVGDPGEVRYLPVEKKFVSSHATPGMQGEVQNTITWLLSMHINKELSFAPMNCFSLQCRCCRQKFI